LEISNLRIFRSCVTLFRKDMTNRTLMITLTFIVMEILIGTILAELYINQYSFWTSSQTLEQFMATVLVIYVVTTIALGTFNLLTIKRLERKLLIRCSVTSILVGTFFFILFFITSDTLDDYFNSVDLSPAIIVLLGLTIGFNFPILKGRGENNVTQQNV
jgi:nitric oxide reductase large subunit